MMFYESSYCAILWHVRLIQNAERIGFLYLQYPPSLNALKAWWDKKNNVTWFLRGQISGKICQCKKLRSSLLILDNRKWRIFYLKDDNVKPWVEVIIVTLLDVSSSDREFPDTADNRAIYTRKNKTRLT